MGNCGWFNGTHEQLFYQPLLGGLFKYSKWRLSSFPDSHVPFDLRDYAIRSTILTMGAWGYKSLQNDSALNELGHLFEKSCLADNVCHSLRQEPREYADEVRATAYLVYVLAKHGLWQDGRLSEVIALAISQLRAIVDGQIYENVNFDGETRHLINQLREVEPKPGQHFRQPPWEP